MVSREYGAKIQCEADADAKPRGIGNNRKLVTILPVTVRGISKCSELERWDSRIVN